MSAVLPWSMWPAVPMIACRTCAAIADDPHTTGHQPSLFELVGVHLHVEVIAPALDLAVRRGFEHAHHRQRDALAAGLERIDPFVENDVAVGGAVQNLELDPGGALEQALDGLA